MVEDPRSDRTPPAAPLPADAEAPPFAAGRAATERRSEQRFRALFDAMFQFIGLMEPDGTLVEINRTALDFGGLRHEDVIGKKFWACPWWQVSEEAPQQVRAAVRRAARGEFVRYETEFLGAGGRVATIDFSIKPVRGDDGAVELLIPEGRVITEAVQARRMQEGLTAAQVGTFEIDLATQAVHRPASTDGIFGFPPDGLPRDLDAYLDRIHPEDLPAALDAIRRAVEEGGEQFVTFRLLLPDGRLRWTAARGVVLPGVRGGSPRLVGAIIDVTAQRTAEQERRRDDEQRHAALEAARLGTWDYDLAEGVVRLDARCRAVFGHDRDVATFAEALSWVHPEDQPEVARVMQAAGDPATGGWFDVEYRLLRPDGEQRWVRAAGNVLFEGEGKDRRAAHYVGVVMDDTERREAERARALLAAIVASSDDAIVSKTLDGTITTWNAGAERVFGYTAEEAVGQQVLMLIPPERHDEEDRILAQIRRGERVAHYDTVRLTKDGRRIDVSIAVSPLRDAAGRIVGASKVARDVTEQKRAARALHETEERLRVALSIVPLVLTHVDRDLRYTWVYNASPLLQEQPLGRRLDELIAPEEAAPLLALKRRVLATGQSASGTFTYNLSDGPHTFDIIVEPLADEDGGVVGAMTASFDVTDRVRAEEALRESEERFRLAASAVAGMVYDWDVATGEVVRTDGLHALIGVRPEDVPAERTWWVDRVHPDDRGQIYGLIRTVLEAAATQYTVEYRIRHEDGRWVHLWDRGHIVRDAAGRAVRVVGSATDVTGRKRAEETLAVRARQQAVIAELGHLALRGVTADPEAVQALMDRAVEAVSETLDVPLCKVLELLPDGDHVLLRAGVGWQPGLVGVATVDTGRDSQAGYTLLSDTPVVVEDLANDDRFSGPPLLCEHGVVSGLSCIVPGTDGAPWGVIGAHATERRAFTQDDVYFLQSVANLLGAALQRQQSVEALRESEARFRAMTDGAPMLVWMADTDERLDYFNAAWLRFTGRTLVEEQDCGWAEGLHPDDRDPCLAAYAAAFEAREPFEVECRLRRHDGQYRWLLNRGTPRYAPSGTFLGYIGSCIDIHERKQAQARALLLAEAGRLIEQALDYEAALSEVARVAVPGFADWCAIDLLQDDGTIEAVAIAHADPAKVQWGWALREQYPVDPDAPTGTPNVIRTGQPELYPDIPDELIQAAAKNEEELQLLREIGYSSVIVAPLRAGGSVIGAVTYANTDSGRHFDETDLAVAEEIGRRAGAAIETARLHRALQVSEERFRAISALTSDFAYAARPDADGRFEREWVSGAYEKITGYEPDDVGEVEPWRHLVHPDDVAEGEAHVAALRSGRPSVCEHRLVTKHGDVRWVRDYARPELDAEGRVVRVIGAVQDITEQKEAEQALRTSEARYRTLFTSIDEGFCLCEMICDEAGRPVDYRFLEVNPVFETQTGLKDPEGKTALELVPDLERHWIETYARAGLGGETLRFEEGSRAMGRWFDVFAAPVEPAGSGRFVLVFTDITARKETEAALRESEARFRQLAEALPEIVYTNDAEGRTDYLNAQWFAYTGQPHDLDPARAVAAVLHPEDAERIAEGWAAAFAAQETFEAEFRLRRHDGQYRWFLTRVVPVRGADDEAVSRWFGTSTDIHAQKATEVELAERVAERTKELERSNRELDQFAYVASHDLKGPLRGIDNLATWIAEDAGDHLPEPSRRHLDLLLGRVQRLEALLDSLLAYSRAGRLSGLAEGVDAGALVRDVAEFLDAPDAVTFEVAEDLPTLTTYRAPLELVFRNLLANAVKHADRPDLHVRVTASDAGAPEGFVTFAVADDGPGIPPEYHERIFGLFQTLRPRDEVEGSGMGLAVVKKTVESLDGTIRVESTPGAGTKFYFTWPRRVGA